MLGHGKHHNCAFCSAAKSVGLISECRDAECADSSHRRGEVLDEDEDEDLQEKAARV